MFGIPWTEWLGYLASLVVAISLLMKSLVKLRWVNLFGSVLFAIYGFLIGAYPVGGFNTVIFFINIMYLIRMHQTRESFELMQIDVEDSYLKRFFSHYARDIAGFFPDFQIEEITSSSETISLYVLRDLAIAGLFIGRLDERGDLKVLIDYVTPPYRDNKSGGYLFKKEVSFLRNLGIKRIIATSSKKAHSKYLIKMGFVQKDNGYELLLPTTTLK